jgi:hypothetical protein
LRSRLRWSEGPVMGGPEQLSSETPNKLPKTVFVGDSKVPKILLGWLIGETG